MIKPHEWLPLDTARDCFQLLVTGPQPMSIDGREFAGLPHRLVPLDELRDLLLSKQCANSTRDAVWAYLVQRSRADRGAWMVACAGMALPTLASTAGWLAARYRGDRIDVHSEVLAGFLEALAKIDLSEPGIVIRLCWAARRAGQAALAESLDAPIPTDSGTASVLQWAPPGHPDLVLARAVGAGILTATEADLISATRLGDVSVAQWAATHGRQLKAVFKARDRAEDRLVSWLRVEAAEHDSTDSVAQAALTELSFVDASISTPPSSRYAVSGRRRNGAPASSDPVSKNGPNSGLLASEENTTSSRTALDPEVR